MKLTSHCSARIARTGARGLAAGALGAALLAGCGGGGDPLSNPPNVSNPPGAGGDKLSFDYFQRCVAPVFFEALPIVQNGVSSTNTCAGSGCHAAGTGTGGALSLVASATLVDLADPANTPAVIRTTAMYKNFYSAQGVTIPGSPLQSRLFEKPLLLNVLHGGGQVFASQDDPHAKLFAYWIGHPMPSGQDEFSTASAGMFTNGTCNTQ